MDSLTARVEALTAGAEAVTAGVEALTKDVRELAQAQQRTEDALKSLVERADLLGRIVGMPVYAVVAGQFAPEPLRIAAQDADVWRVTNGRTVGPQDADEDA